MEMLPEVKVIFREKDVKVYQSNGLIAYHDARGGVFLLTHTAVGEENAIQEYTNVFAYQDKQAELDREQLRACVATGTFVGSSFYMLVRSGIPGHWNYYPIPLLFGTDEERQISSTLHRKPVPKDNWLKAKRNLVRKLVNLPLGD